MTTPLSEQTLARLAGRVRTPGYDRSALRPAIVHFGVGNFHRAHQAVYLDDLNGRGGDGWGIVGAGVRAADGEMRAALAAQDYLYTVVEQDAETSAARVVGALVDHLPVDVPADTIARLADPAVAIVSLTVTEGGYFLDAAGRFDADHPDIVGDVAAPDRPRTVFGLIAAGLAARRAAGVAPFTVMSCDNIPHNGIVARNAVAGIAEGTDAALGAWIRENVAFPNGMVDRITPATGDRERDLLAADFGIADARPVFCEPFRQWVLEDTFPAGRPALDEVGVQFVPDVAPYERMKISILNGGHSLIAYPAGLLGITFVHEAMAHPLVRGFLEAVETDEIVPVVPPAPGIDFTAYFAQVAERFANPKIGDTVRRIAFDGSSKTPKFIVPSLADALAAGRPVTGLALEAALWCRYCAGTDEAGHEIAPNDPIWDDLTARAARARNDPAVWLTQREIYGDLGGAAAFASAFAAALDSLWTRGVAATIERYLAARG